MDKNTLLDYRWQCAFETLQDAKKLLSANASPRSIINRAYYAMFYAVLALFIKNDIAIHSSKHSTVISRFDSEFVKPGKIPKECSRSLHRAFDDRQEFDYKDFAKISLTDAEGILREAETFIATIKNLP
ncbi:MAG: HEPN domain-containing protein [Chitinivibrionales bacterium]|nr:HEPN domain-containing protein [Chitinivibrionales bacterium]